MTLTQTYVLFGLIILLCWIIPITASLKEIIP